MSERFLEDLRAGDCFESASFAVTAEGIKEFARIWDPQAFHLEEKAANASVFAGLSASGWHTAAITMRLYVTNGMNLAGGSVGLGVDELRWPRAVRPGDVLRLTTEILETRASKSKPDRGVIRIRNVTRNQNGEIVQSFCASVLVLRRLLT